MLDFPFFYLCLGGTLVLRALGQGPLVAMLKGPYLELGLTPTMAIFKSITLLYYLSSLVLDFNNQECVIFFKYWYSIQCIHYTQCTHQQISTKIISYLRSE